MKIKGLLIILQIFALIFSINLYAEEKIDFSIKPLEGDEIVAGGLAEIRFRIPRPKDQDINTPKPAAWVSRLKGDEKTSCKEKVSLYLKGDFLSGADIDLNRYFILTLNSDPTISVIDPFSGVKGFTQLYTMIMLKSPGHDWEMSDKRLFVTMPAVNQVAVIDIEKFKVADTIDAGENPMKILLQPDKRYLWITNCTKNEQKAGVTVVDPKTLKVITHINTGPGHHEIAIDEDGKYIYVLNIESGILSVIDIDELKIKKELKTGKSPVSIAVSDKKVYVAHKDGKIVFIDSRGNTLLGDINTSEGLNNLKFSKDGKWGFALNEKNSTVYVFNSLDNKIVRNIKVDRPLNVSFTKNSAYILKGASEELAVLRISDLEKGNKIEPVDIIINTLPPRRNVPKHIYSHDNPADIIFPAPEGDVMLFAQSGMIQYIKDGMQAPMGSFRSYTKSLRSIFVLDRSLKEIESGVYCASVRIPESGKYEVALLYGSPSQTECFEFTALPNPKLAKKEKVFKIEFLDTKKKVKVTEEVNLRVKLIDITKKEPRENIEDVIVLVSLAPGHQQERYRARAVGEGIYEVTLKPSVPGIYYIFFSIPSLDVKSHQLDFFTLQVVEDRQ